MFKKTLFAMATTALLSGAAFNASAADEGHGTVTFTGTVITAPCSVAPESSNIEVWLGQVADSVLNGSSKATPADFSIHLVDCTLSVDNGDGTTTKTDKVNVTFTSANVDGTDASLMANTKQGTYGGASNVGVRILDSGYKDVTLGSKTAVSFVGENPTQNLDFHARMEKIGSSSVTAGTVYAQANYVLSYK